MARTDILLAMAQSALNSYTHAIVLEHVDNANDWVEV